MKKPNLDDYDNGHRDKPESLVFPLIDANEDNNRHLRRRALFLQIWNEKRREDGRRYSDVSGKVLPERYSSLYFDHLLERSKYPELEFEPENIALCTPDEHRMKSNKTPLPKHQELIEKAKERFGIL